jgi:uncharacterized Zn finger protein (UPF0148 family)
MPISFLRLASPFAFLMPALAHAVAGGAGGGGGGGGGGDDLVAFAFQVLVWIIFDIPFPFNLIILVLLAAAVRWGTRNVRAQSGLNDVAAVGAPPPAYRLPQEFQSRNPDFDPSSLLAKAGTAFPAIQQAWSQQNLSPVRRWISDGVWQRFNTQFAMMRLLDQSNQVSNVNIRSCAIDAWERDGAFDIVHVAIRYTAEDDFVCRRFAQLDRRGPIELLEYWSFMRKAGAGEHDLYQSNHCPACGTPLPEDMGETARCPSCGAVSTLGEYDWVLAEITQADDYANQDARLAKSGRLTERIRSAFGGDGDFSVQLIEDKASNAYMQILGAQVTRCPEAMRRFVADGLFEKLSRDFGLQESFVYNRLYLNSVTLIDYYREDEHDNMVVAIKRTAQRVAIDGDTLRPIDHGLYADNQIIILSRRVGAGIGKGSLYAHACPACGAPIADTLDTQCTYCGSTLNSTQHEWIVSALLSPEEYRTHLAEQPAAPATGVAGDDLDPLFAARDLVFNNLLVMIACDGTLTPEEIAMAEQAARRMGYQPAKLAGMLDLARHGKLALRLPEDRASAIKVQKLMEKAALADKNISPAERALLDEVAQRVEAIRL